MGIRGNHTKTFFDCNDFKEFHLTFKELKRKTLKETINQKVNCKIKQIWL